MNLFVRGLLVAGIYYAIGVVLAVVSAVLISGGEWPTEQVRFAIGWLFAVWVGTSLFMVPIITIGWEDTKG